MTEGELTHRLMQARALTDGRPELELARYFIDAALRETRHVHREWHPQPDQMQGGD